MAESGLLNVASECDGVLSSTTDRGFEGSIVPEYIHGWYLDVSHTIYVYTDYAGGSEWAVHCVSPDLVCRGWAWSHVVFGSALASYEWSVSHLNTAVEGGCNPRDVP